MSNFWTKLAQKGYFQSKREQYENINKFNIFDSA